MKNFSIAGFPETGEKVELPNIASLIAMPWFQYASIEDVRRYGGDVYRNLLDKIPLTNSRKHVLVTSRVQYLTPSKLSIKFVDRWHTDGCGLPLLQEKNDITHLLISKCTAVTEFNEQPTETGLLDPFISQKELNHYLEANKKALGLSAKPIEPERFVTFTVAHAHRAVQPTEPEFRFMLRVVESDNMVPESISKTYVSNSLSYNEHPDGTQLVVDQLEHTAAYKNIDKADGKITIYL